jgi:hypothetical protein
MPLDGAPYTLADRVGLTDWMTAMVVGQGLTVMCLSGVLIMGVRR